VIGFIFSTAGYTLLPTPGEKVYNSSKTALWYLTEGLRHEIIHSGSKTKVTVSLIRTINVVKRHFFTISLSWHRV
jgi:short-subunit dehydrogenase